MTSPLENLERMLAELPPRRGPRIPFPTICGAYFALHRGFPQTIVAQAFGISSAAASHLANCLREPERGPWHYRRVALEFVRLGEKQFGERYYTADIDDRIHRLRSAKRLKGHVDPELILHPGDSRTPPPARTSKWDGVQFPVERLDHSEIVNLIIAWREAGEDLDGSGEPLPAGWAFRCLDGTEAELNWSQTRHRTGDEAHRAAIYGYGFEVEK